MTDLPTIRDLEAMSNAQLVATMRDLAHARRRTVGTPDHAVLVDTAREAEDEWKRRVRRHQNAGTPLGSVRTWLGSGDPYPHEAYDADGRPIGRYASEDEAHDAVRAHAMDGAA